MYAARRIAGMTPGVNATLRPLGVEARSVIVVSLFKIQIVCKNGLAITGERFCEMFVDGAKPVLLAFACMRVLSAAWIGADPAAMLAACMVDRRAGGIRFCGGRRLWPRGFCRPSMVATRWPLARERSLRPR